MTFFYSLTRDFISCLESFGLQQHVSVPTHSKGHTLDLICCSGVSPIDLSADELPITDHFLLSVDFALPLSSTKSPCTISFRNIEHIDIGSLSAGIKSLPDITNLSSPDDLESHCNTGLQNILNSFAPLKTRSVCFSQSVLWITPELRLMKAKGRQIERLSRKTGLAVHKDIYKNHIIYIQYKNCIIQTKSTYLILNVPMKVTPRLCFHYISLSLTLLTILPSLNIFL